MFPLCVCMCVLFVCVCACVCVCVGASLAPLRAPARCKYKMFSYDVGLGPDL